MRITYFNDPHARSQAPISRNDANFGEVVLEKLREIFYYAHKDGSDCVICGGDLFDTPQPSLNLLIGMIKLLKEYKDIPFYLCAGNHDIYAHQIDTVDRTAIGLLESAGYLKMPDVLDIEGVKIKFLQYYHGAEADLAKEDFIEDCDVLVTHAMVVEKPFFGDHILYQDVKARYKVMLCSHYHPGFEPVNTGTQLILAPGALTRTSIDKHNLTRDPSFVQLDITDGKISYQIIPLECAKKAEEVFYIESTIVNSGDTDYKDKLFQSIDNLDFSSCDLSVIVSEFCKINNIEDNIKSEILSRI